jgi:hypothetical protein
MMNYRWGTQDLAPIDWSRSCGWPVRALWLSGTPSSRRSWPITTALCQTTGEYKGSAHQPLRAGDDLQDAFAGKEERCLSQALTLQYDKVIFVLEPSEQAKAAIGKRVTVIDYPDSRLSIRYNGVEFVYRQFDNICQIDQGAIGGNKRLGPISAIIRDEQLRRGPERRSGPRRRDQRDARLLKVG